MTLEQRKWGSAIIIENNELYCGKILKIKKGYRMSLQYHKLKDETLYVLTGQILVEYEKEFTHKIYKETLHPGEKVRIKPLRIHRVTGLTDADIMEISTHSEDSDSYHIEDGGKVPE
jgi:mannose-6-phosphate isomerase-like protein (cupin superfamily)